MSVVLSLPDAQKHRKPDSRIYLEGVDTDGQSVDPRFIEAGYRKEDEFFRYRSDELNDEAVIANLIETAVYTASGAVKKEPLRDVGGYLFTVFANLADREIARNPRIQNYEPELLANLPYARCDTSNQLLDRIQLREILDQLPTDIRWALQRRNFGFKVREIAKQMNVSADCLSTRIRRALRHLFGDDVR